jgi:type IV pilus assembly protein PilF
MNIARSFLRVAAVAALALSGALLTGCANGERGGAQLAGDKQTSAEKAGELNKQLGTEYLKKGNLALAKEKLERAEKYNPRDAEVHSVLAVLYERLGSPKQVDEHYKAAVRLAPKDPQISNNYAVYLCRNGRTDEGVKRFIEAAQNPLYRTPEIAFSNAGVCLRSAKRLSEAATTFSRALTIRPNYAEAAFQYADLELERGDLAKSRGIIDKYLGTYDATADLLLTAVRVTRAQSDRVAEDKYTRRLRVEFPNSQQLRSLNDSAPATPRNPG